MSQLHVRQIETFLKESYPEYFEGTADRKNCLSKALARYSIDLALEGSSSADSVVVEITDGGEDRGVDGIAVDPTRSLVIAVQSKWRDDGSGSMDLSGVLRFLDGVRALLDFESRVVTACSPGTKAAVRSAMDRPGGHLKMITATTAEDDLSSEVSEPISDFLRILNSGSEDHPIAEHVHYRQVTFFDSLSKPPREVVDLEVQLLDWGHVTSPNSAYYGRANAMTIADWHRSFGASLFADNIRVVLPDSDINEGIYKTATETPDVFWYYNNGITLLARTVKRSLAGAANRDAGFFKLHGASVVNGAQTVSTLGRVLHDGHAEQLEAAYVPVRIIQIPEDDEDFPRLITRFANTQNVVSTQDFVFLDAEQHRLVKELRLLGYEYLLRAGEIPQTTNRSKVIEVRQAAVGLACASTLNNAVIAKREVSRLFDRTSGPYKALFNPQTNGVTLSRSVAVVEQVDEILNTEAQMNEGVRGGVAVHGNRVISHLVLTGIGSRNLANPDFDFDAATTGMPESALDILEKFTDNFPENSYPGNVFKNRTRVEELIAASGL